MSLRILSQAAGLYVQYKHTAGIGSHPQFVAAETEGMGILTAQHALMGIIQETAFLRRIAHQTAIVAGHPDTSVLVLTETGDDITRQSCTDSEGLETLAYRRDIMDTTVERPHPEAAFHIAGDGIHKAVARAPIVIHQPLPLTGLRVKTDNPVVTADADCIVVALEQGMDMVSHLRERR